MYRWKDCVEALKTHHTASCFIKHTGDIQYIIVVMFGGLIVNTQMLHKPNEAIDDTEMWLLSDLTLRKFSHGSIRLL